jgi:hypothetical protein
MMARRALIVFIVTTLAGCTQTTAPSSPGPNPTTAPIETPLPLDPNVIGLTCGQSPTFHPAVLDGRGHAEDDADAAAAALRDYLRTAPPEAGLPTTGWTRVAQLAHYVQFVAPRAGGGGWSIVAFQLREGRWDLQTAGDCRLAPAVPEGVTIAEWRLDPAFSAPDPGERTIHVLINERACSGGRSPEGRVDPPIVVRGPEAVTITILVREIPGGNDCPGNPDFAMPIELPEPLGGRPLFDGGVFPAFGPIAAYALDCGPMGMVECVRFAQQAAADAERQRPGHRVTWVSIITADDYQLGFEDGTMIGADIN